jgi:hypothetical protein
MGWQELVLELNAVCERCNAILARGMRGAVAVYDRPGPRKFICPTCLTRLQQEPEKLEKGESDDQHEAD